MLHGKRHVRFLIPGSGVLVHMIDHAGFRDDVHHPKIRRQLLQDVSERVVRHLRAVVITVYEEETRKMCLTHPGEPRDYPHRVEGGGSLYFTKYLDRPSIIKL